MRQGDYFKTSFFVNRIYKWSAAWFHYILIAAKLAYNKKKPYKTLYC